MAKYTKTLLEATMYIFEHASELMEEGRYEDPADAVQHAWESWDEHEGSEDLKAELLEQMKPEQQALQFVRGMASLPKDGETLSGEEDGFSPSPSEREYEMTYEDAYEMLHALIEQARAIVAPRKEEPRVLMSANAPVKVINGWHEGSEGHVLSDSGADLVAVTLTAKGPDQPALVVQINRLHLKEMES